MSLLLEGFVCEAFSAKKDGKRNAVECRCERLWANSLTKSLSLASGFVKLPSNVLEQMEGGKGILL